MRKKIHTAQENNAKFNIKNSLFNNFFLDERIILTIIKGYPNFA
jgi:hypothetical protein